MARQRHNVGFMAVDRIAERHGFTPWRSRFKGLAAEGNVGGEKVLALKPLTYMNDSGASVQPAAAFFKLPPGDITAFHDELDLAPGRVRVKQGGGAAGHNGLRSMDRLLGSAGYWRVRLGIGHPGHKDRVLRATCWAISPRWMRCGSPRCWTPWRTRRCSWPPGSRSFS